MFFFNSCLNERDPVRVEGEVSLHDSWLHKTQKMLTEK